MLEPICLAGVVLVDEIDRLLSKVEVVALRTLLGESFCCNDFVLEWMLFLLPFNVPFNVPLGLDLSLNMVKLFLGAMKLLPALFD